MLGGRDPVSATDFIGSALAFPFRKGVYRGLSIMCLQAQWYLLASPQKSCEVLNPNTIVNQKVASLGLLWYFRTAGAKRRNEGHAQDCGTTEPPSTPGVSCIQGPIDLLSM